jgi:hypothetical protein
LKVKLSLVAALLSALAFSAPALAVPDASTGSSVAASASVNTSPPLISGSARSHELLTADPGSWSGDTSGGFSYQWQRCDTNGANCNPIASATNTTYTLQDSEIGATVVVSVTALDGPTTAASAATALVGYPVPAGGHCSLVPRFGYADATIFSVTCENWSDYFQQSPLTYELQIWSCDGQTENCTLEYTSTPTTVPQVESSVSGFFNPGGSTFLAKVNICQADGACTVWSDVGYLSDDGAPHNNPAVLPTISGNLWPGQTLSADPGDWANDPTSISYQWHSCPESLPYDHSPSLRHTEPSYYGCSQIAGATSDSYTLSAGDVGSALLVEVSAANAAGTTIVISPTSALVGASAPPGINYIYPLADTVVRGRQDAGMLRVGGSADVVSAAYSVDGGTSWVPMVTYGPNEWASTVDYREFANGSHSFQLRVTDADGQTADGTRTLLIDNDEPANPLVTSPVVGSTITSLPTTFTITTEDRADEVAVWDTEGGFFGTATVGNAERTLWTFSADLSGYQDQADFQLLFRSSNSAGTIEIHPSFVLDLVLDAPRPSFVSPLAGATVDGSFLIEITTDEQTDLVTLLIGNDGFNPVYDADSNSWKQTVSGVGRPEGDLVLYAYAENAAGELGRTITVTNDSYHVSPPSWTGPEEGDELSVNTNGFQLQVLTTDSNDAVNFYLDGVLLGAASEQGEPDSNDWRLDFDASAHALGDHVLRAVSYAAGEASVPAEITITIIDEPQLDTSGLEVSGFAAVIGETLTASGATASGTPTPTLAYSWQVCPPGTTSGCHLYLDSASYSPLASELGWSVLFFVTAENGVGDAASESFDFGNVSAAAEENGGFGDPPAAPAPTPAAAPSPAPAPGQAIDAPMAGQTVWGERSNPARQVIVSANLDDVIRTGSADDVIRSFGGRDRIFNGRGGGFVYAGAGNDVVWAQHGHARVYCGPGTDRLYANRFVRSLGCETVVVAANNRWVRVKLDGKGFPILPAAFVKPYFQG